MVNKMTFKLDSSLGSKLGAYNQSHYIEVAQEAIFMEQNIRFGLILGWLAILKKMGFDYEQLLRPVFSCFLGQKKC